MTGANVPTITPRTMTAISFLTRMTSSGQGARGSDGASRGRCDVRRLQVPPRFGETEKCCSAQSADLMPVAVAAATQPAPLSRWRHGFKSRWDYQENGLRGESYRARSPESRRGICIHHMNFE